eukprot:TRINITY_DN1892_c0_g1_i1.p1 TRINITY_DN1892_c0_g1~~TRINITY_DN1892_c0_g1_i1.p1  ORF type:complete len:893 (+),score=304.60 TRINITY_DN1892_c0_g1_i1:135-2813(+)
MPKGDHENIKIYLRIRPANNPSKNYTINRDKFSEARIHFHLDKHNHENYLVNNQIEDYDFKFDNVFDRETTQEQIFTNVARECVDNVVQGFNSTIFAYGQTGSGKTFSITGGSESYAQRGMIPRSIAMVFDEVNKMADADITVRVSYLQIYNDKGQDLLNKGQDARSLDDLPKVTVHEADDEFVIKDLGQHKCVRPEDALNLLFLGDVNRMYCETSMNAFSSRSHCIFTISLEQRRAGSAVVRRSKLHLVDLAGSERIKKTGAEGKLAKEARYINVSLHYLQEVIRALCERAEGKRDHVPYRQSLMTMVLRDSLGGNCRTVMLATAHPQDAFMDESISTCKFAQRVASIKVNAKINEETDPTLLVKKLKAENAELKEELAMLRKGDEGADRVLSHDEFERCRAAVERYIRDEEGSKLTGLEGDPARIFACFQIMKEIILKKGITNFQVGQGGKGAPKAENPSGQDTTTPQEQHSDPLLRPDSGSTNPNSTILSNGSVLGGGGVGSGELEKRLEKLSTQIQQKDNEINMLLNIVQKYQVKKVSSYCQTGGGCEVGVSPLEGGRTQPAAPMTAVPPTTHPSGQQPLALPMDAPASGAAGRGAKSSQNEQVQMATLQDKLQSDYNLETLDAQGMELFKDTTKAFEQFRRSWRKFEQIERQKAEQAERCDKAKKLAVEINGHSQEIAAVKNKIQQMRAERATHGWADPDEEETQLFEALDLKKTMYRKLVAELAEEKRVYDHFQGILKSVSAKLSQDFENWWTLRRWQMGGSEKPNRSDSIKAFSDKQFNNSRTTPRQMAQMATSKVGEGPQPVGQPAYHPPPQAVPAHPPPPNLAQTQPGPAQPAPSRGTQLARTQPAQTAPGGAGAAPESEVQSELQRLFQARERLRHSFNGKE